MNFLKDRFAFSLDRSLILLLLETKADEPPGRESNAAH
jgi:hypothetical protein